MQSKYSWLGEWTIKIFDSSTKELLHEDYIKNTIMNVGLDELCRPLYGGTPDLEIKYLAVGTSSATVAVTQTALGAEVFRTPYVSRTTTSQEVNTVYTVLDSEAQVQIEEIGVFAGTAASGTSDTGIMLSRILWSYDKTPTNIEVQFQRKDTIQRG